LLAGNTGHTRLKVWQVEDMAELSATPPGHTGVVEAIAFTEGGEQLLTAGASRELAAWHTNTAKHRYIKRAPPALERVGTITDIAVSPDQQHAISLGFQVGLDCWNVTTGELRFHLPRHGQTGTYGSHAVAFSADGKRFYSFGPEYYLRVWDFRTGKALEEYRPFPPDAELIKRDGEVAVSDPFGMAGAAGVPPISVSEFSEDGSTLAFLADKIYFVDTSTGNVIRTFDSIATAHGIFSKSLEQFAFGEGATFSICKLSDQGKVASIDVDAARSARPICYSPDSRLLAVLCFPLARETSEPWISIYDSASHEPLYRVEGVPLGHGRMAFTGDNRHIAVGQLDATILMFELAPFRVPSE
jgi:WD40 repeat protein